MRENKEICPSAFVARYTLSQANNIVNLLITLSRT